MFVCLSIVVCCLPFVVLRCSSCVGSWIMLVVFSLLFVVRDSFVYYYCRCNVPVVCVLLLLY